MKRVWGILCACIVLLTVCPMAAVAAGDTATVIELSSVKSGKAYTHTAKVNGAVAKEYDYVWHVDPTTVHSDVKNSPAEYYTGTKPSGDEAVYVAHDIYYYPELDESKFKQVKYDGETEWVYMYEAKGYENYIFSTLPSLRSGFPSRMMHSAEEAYQNAVLHITKPGTYILKGEWHGQVRVDLGEDAFDDESMRVVLKLDTVTIECTVASGIVFENVYECDNAWEERDTHSKTVNTDKAGANIVLADGSENTVSGTNIFRILKPQYKKDNSTDTYPAQKKRLKVDGAVYSYQSLNITGEQEGSGVLNIESGFEGMNSELHLTINGGNVNIFSQDDGINVNEDEVSVLTVNGGSLHICAGLGAEGDGIDSNGYVVVNGGTVISAANPAADSGLDSDCGSFVNGGTVVALGSTMDWAESDDAASGEQAVLNLRFGTSQSSDEALVITDTNGGVLFAYDPDRDAVSGQHVRSYSGAIVSSSQLKVGTSCHIYVGGEVVGKQVSGVYDIATVSGFNGATRQCYSGNTVGGFGGGRPEGNFDPNNIPEGFSGSFDPENMPENFGDFGGGRPEGNFDPNNRPEGFGGGRPEGNFDPNNRPEGFGGGRPEGDFNPNNMPGGNYGGGQAGATCQYEATFVLSETVNAFSGVADYQHDLQQANGVYTCSVCGASFADENGTSPANAPSPWLWVFIVVLVVAAAVTAFAVVVLVKRKRAAQADNADPQ